MSAVKPIPPPVRIDFVANDREAAARHFKAECGRYADRVPNIVELATPVRLWIDSIRDRADKHVAVAFHCYLNGGGPLEIGGQVKQVPKVRA